MDILNGNIKKIYFKYLSATFGSAMITSIYSIVDMSMVGQYSGPQGTAALAVVAPVWNIVYGFGLLTGIGASVILSTKRAEGAKQEEYNKYFTASFWLSIILSVISLLLIIFAEKQIFGFFGGNKTLLPIAHEYIMPIKFVFPLFLFNQMLAAFLRNDGSPSLATKAVLAGGIFNIFGDWFFVFGIDMGVKGAGVATAIGATITFVIMLTHFFNKKNTLKLVKADKLFSKFKQITVTGFSIFFIDLAMGILAVIFNRQIMKYLNADALAVYGPIINVSTMVQCCAYSVGQAAQPIISSNFGAKKYGRIKETLKYAVITCSAFSIIWTAVSEAVPNLFTKIFMNPTETVLQIAPSIIRKYAISFLLLPINIFSTYYFQAILKPKTSFAVSVMRGLIVSGALLYIIPIVSSADNIWYTMAITEAITLIYAAVKIRRYTNQLHA